MMKAPMLKLCMVAAVTSASATFLSVGKSSGDGSYVVGVAAAQARVGRPATPGSVAGVARRTTRRTVRRTVVAPGVVAPVVRPACGYYPYPPCY